MRFYYFIAYMNFSHNSYEQFLQIIEYRNQVFNQLTNLVFLILHKTIQFSKNMQYNIYSNFCEIIFIMIKTT